MIDLNAEIDRLVIAIRIHKAATASGDSKNVLHIRQYEDLVRRLRHFDPYNGELKMTLNATACITCNHPSTMLGEFPVPDCPWCELARVRSYIAPLQRFARAALSIHKPSAYTMPRMAEYLSALEVVSQIPLDHDGAAGPTS